MIRILIFVLLLASPGFAQEADPRAVEIEIQAPLDYEAWSQRAGAAEAALEDRRTSTQMLQEFREAIVEWRTRFMQVQSRNDDRLQTVRTQLEALGVAPEEGVEEAPEIASRRNELRDQIVQLEAPRIAAEEAFTRASGLIGEIDALIRERETEALLELYPTPANPALWPQAVGVLFHEVDKLRQEVVDRYRTSTAPTPFRTNLPLIVLLTVFAVVGLTQTQRWIDRGLDKIGRRIATRRGRNALGIILSTLRIAIPVAGFYALGVAAKLTGLLGPSSAKIIEIMPIAGALAFAGIWLATATFPKQEGLFNPLGLEAGPRREGRFLTIMLGLVMAMEAVRVEWLVPQIKTDEVLAVLSAPLPILAGLVLWRLGGLLRRSGQVSEDEEGVSIVEKIMRLLGLGARLAAVVSVGLILIGYIPATLAIVFPMILSLALVFLLLIIVLLQTDIYDILMKRASDAGASLVTSLGALLSVAVSLPVFAMIWGMTSAELLEYWVLFTDGFSIGEARIRPSDFLVFVLIFSLGYMVTKAVQGVMGSSVLPKTSMDMGAQRAAVSGLGYVGIFLSALIAITTAGIDLSSLAIVLGALSVGIGFGLQNIVSNFVSGIILLIERPVSEGDWIEVNGVMGTVKGVSVRSTTVETFDRTDVIVPNADLVSGAVTNWTRSNRLGRLIIKVGVNYGADTRKIIGLLEDIGGGIPEVSKWPSPPSAFFRGFGDSSLNFELRLILTDVSNLLGVETEVHHQIAEVFAREGIEIPFVQRDLWIRNPEALFRDDNKALDGS